MKLSSWVRCGACLYRFLIFAPFLTFFIVEYAEMGRDDVTWHTVTSLDEHVRESKTTNVQHPRDSRGINDNMGKI